MSYFVGEMIQNASGLGLHFVNGNPEWDLTTSMNMSAFRVSFCRLQKMKTYVPQLGCTNLSIIFLVHFRGLQKCQISSKTGISLPVNGYDIAFTSEVKNGGKQYFNILV